MNLHYKVTLIRGDSRFVNHFGSLIAHNVLFRNIDNFSFNFAKQFFFEVLYSL